MYGFYMMKIKKAIEKYLAKWNHGCYTKDMLPLVLILLAGCASPMVYQSHSYPGMAKGGGVLLVQEVNEAKLFDECDGGDFDNGDRISATGRERLKGCNWPGNIVYLRGWSCILGHELCHEAGLPLEVCDKEFHTDRFCK